MRLYLTFLLFLKQPAYNVLSNHLPKAPKPELIQVVPSHLFIVNHVSRSSRCHSQCGRGGEL